MRLGTVLLAALLIAGCARSGDPETGTGDPMEQELAASIEVKVSSTVRMVLHVTNSSDAPVTFTFPTSQRYDFIVTDTDGDEVWRWSDGMAFLQAISEATLEPGESWAMEAVWDPGDRSGRYAATGVLTARAKGLRQSAAFELH